MRALGKNVPSCIAMNSRCEKYAGGVTNSSSVRKYFGKHFALMRFKLYKQRRVERGKLMSFLIFGTEVHDYNSELLLWVR